jgi:hypothetical protein
MLHNDRHNIQQRADQDSLVAAIQPFVEQIDVRTNVDVIVTTVIARSSRRVAVSVQLTASKAGYACDEL